MKERGGRKMKLPELSPEGVLEWAGYLFSEKFPEISGEELMKENFLFCPT
jgi:hypothetical protein